MKQPSVWLEFSPLAQATQSINLGQGFPSWAPPQFVQEQAIKANTGGNFSTYARSAGHPHLVKTLSEHYADQLNHLPHPESEIIVTAGATEALYLAITSFINPKDEVIIIEPAFDIYLGALKKAQATIKTIALDDQLQLDWDKFTSLFTPQTKMIILNSPHNPSGKVFSKEELSKIADIIKKNKNCLVISDEVYEHLVYDDHKHISFASLPDMYERTITISSAGKTFSTTGWKIGWAIGPKELIGEMQHLHQWVMFSVSTPHQEAIVNSLIHAKKTGFYSLLKDDYQKKRDLLYHGLKEAALNPILPQGSFFILCDIQNKKISQKEDLEKIIQWNAEGVIQVDTTTLELHDYNFCRSLSLHYSVTAIPTSAFYLNKSDQQSWIRFAFCKDENLLLNAIEKLKKLKKLS